MATKDSQLDVLVLGEHPSAAFCAALLSDKKHLRVLHATLPGESSADRLLLVNPALFVMHPMLSSLRRRLKTSAIYGVRFLADDLQTHGEYHSRAGMALLVSYQALRRAMLEMLRKQKVPTLITKQVQVQRVTECGLEVLLNGRMVYPKLLVLAGALSGEEYRILGIGDHDRDSLHRYTFLRFKAGRSLKQESRPIIQMSLDLKGMLYWGWLMQADGWAQLAVEQPTSSLNQLSSQDLLNHWLNILRGHSVINDRIHVPLESAESMDLSFGGALAQESLANHTVMIGPAGGFYSACGEDIYPNCWSALYAANVIKKAMKETHLQDALDPYRSRWRTTLGEYLRGPQQNLRYLLPLIYRNPVMTCRMTEAILLGKSVVR